MESFEHYKNRIKEDIAEVLSDTQNPPVLFVGSGVSRRYFNAPTWADLLAAVCVPGYGVPRPLNYYSQKHANDLAAVAAELAPLVAEWAWEAKPDLFAADAFGADKPQSLFLKTLCSQHLEALLGSTNVPFDESLADEVLALANIPAASIITTNFDRLLERIFVHYQPVIGEQVLRADPIAIGEIYKVHGCCSVPESLVLTSEDYVRFAEKQKYLSGKLLSFFVEFPVFFLGYSLRDDNIRRLLGDIDELLSPDGKVVPNVYFVEWKADMSRVDEEVYEGFVQLNDNKTLRVKRIVTDSFTWLFEALSSVQPVPVRMDVLRKVMQRITKIIRTDVPRQVTEIQFDQIEGLLEGDNVEIARVFGIGHLDGCAVNLDYPYTTTQLSQKLGHATWHYARKCIDELRDSGQPDISKSDNSYHIWVPSGKGGTHKYSNRALELLRMHQEGRRPVVELDGTRGSSDPESPEGQQHSTLAPSDP